MVKEIGLKIICILKKYLTLCNWKLFVSRIVTWHYNHLHRIIISYLKAYNRVEIIEYK